MGLKEFCDSSEVAEMASRLAQVALTGGVPGEAAETRIWAAEYGVFGAGVVRGVESDAPALLLHWRPKPPWSQFEEGPAPLWRWSARLSAGGDHEPLARALGESGLERDVIESAWLIYLPRPVPHAGPSESMQIGPNSGTLGACVDFGNGKTGITTAGHVAGTTRVAARSGGSIIGSVVACNDPGKREPPRTPTLP